LKYPIWIKNKSVIDFRLSSLLIIAVSYILELLHHMVAGDATNVSEACALSIFRVDPEYGGVIAQNHRIQ
jgi:hypothetical protein